MDILNDSKTDTDCRVRVRTHTNTHTEAPETTWCGAAASDYSAPPACSRDPPCRQWLPLWLVAVVEEN